ncbi:MAG: M23 family metallopeptidase [Actinomycetota bacterium]
MRVIARVLVLGLLVGLQQLLAPMTGMAQVDPCSPVPIPGLCDPVNDVVEPSPSPSPSPKPEKTPKPPKGGGGGGGGGGNQGGGGGGGQQGGGNNKQGGAKDGQAGALPPAPTGPFTVSSPNNSQRLMEILAQIEQYGMPVQETIYQVVGSFPVAGLASWTDDWHACRDGCTRFHEGLDIFGQEGTPLVAAADGVVTQKLVGDLSGISLEIEDAQGVQYFYAHLSAWAEPIQVGDQVHVGQVIGYLGHTGNAMYTPPHVHFELQPGGVPVAPKPFVDKWVEIATLRAEQLLAEVSGAPAPETSDFRITRLFNLSGGGEILESGAERVLALAGIQPTVSSLEVARQLLGQMAYEIDWAGQPDPTLTTLVDDLTAPTSGQDLSGATPLTPFGSTDTTDSQPEQGD